MLGGLVGAALFTYGATVEVRRLVVRRRTLPLPGWPERLHGFRLAVLGDFHLGNVGMEPLMREAIQLALAEQPDMIALVGDFVEDWGKVDPAALGDLLEPLLLMEGNAVAVLGNHDYFKGEPHPLAAILDEINVKLLRNQAWFHQGIQWVGVDSANERRADPFGALADAQKEPIVVLWHEPDLVDWLPSGTALQISAHGHGGQFLLGGWAPVKSRNARRYPGGWYPNASTPLYVTTGVGTTLLPARFGCPPEVAILTLVPASA